MELIVNIEAYERMEGPTMSSGLLVRFSLSNAWQTHAQVALNTQEDIAMIGGQSVAVPPGFRSDIVLNNIEVNKRVVFYKFIRVSTSAPSA